MKAAAFDYARPRSLDEVIALLADHGDEARLLAGGQTLLATLNMRLSEPSLLIDLNGIAALQGIDVRGHVLRIGAMVTHSAIESSPLVARHAPLLPLAVRHIGHRAIRNRGTFGGSVAYADPAAEWPACLLALDGTVVARGPGGERRIAARDFFVDLYVTSLAPCEIVVACELPLATEADVFGFDELARRHGDYAIVGVAMSARRGSIERPAPAPVGGAAQLRQPFDAGEARRDPHRPGGDAPSPVAARVEPSLDDPAGGDPEPSSAAALAEAHAVREDLDSYRLQQVRLAFLGIATTPVRAPATEALFEGRVASPALIDEAVESLRAELQPLADLTNSAATKRHLASVLARRVLTAQLLF